MTIQNPASWMEGGSHPAEDDRRFIATLTNDNEGLFAAGDMAVTQQGTPDMTVDVAGGRGYVLGTEATYQGTYFFENRGVTNLAISAAHATLARKDLVVAMVEDSNYSGATLAWSLAVVTGTADAAPADPTQPPNSLLLARVNVAALASSILNANIDDLRTFFPAAGAVNKFDATAPPGVSNDSSESYTVGSSWVDVTADLAYIAADVTVGAAVWVQTTSQGSDVFADDVFRVQDNGDATKQIAFQASGITTGTTRTITMPDADVTLGQATGLSGADGDVITHQPLLYATDGRSTTLTYTGDDITQVLEKDGATTVKQTDLTYTGTDLTSVVELADGVTVTTTLTYTGDKLTSTGRVVS